MISRFNASNTFSLSALQAIQDWANYQLITPIPVDIIGYNTDTIWNDSYYGPENIPCAHNISAFSYLQTNPDGTAVSFQPDGPYPESPETATVKANVYWEMCNIAIDNASCAFTTKTSTNTAVEVAGCAHYYLVNGEWITLFEDVSSVEFAYQNQPPSAHPYKYCTDPAIQAWIDEDRYDPAMAVDVNGVRCWNPSGGAFPHPWSSSVNFPDGFDFENSVDAVCAQLFARVVQIDDALPNDFDEANFCTYAGTDTRDATHTNNHSASVQGHFRAVPKTGQWALFGVVRGFATKELFDANPPPLAPSPLSEEIFPNSLELIWDDMFGGNLNWTTATATSLGQYDPDDIPTAPIGTSTYPVPTANMWTEVEMEGVDRGCSRSIDPATGLENPQGTENYDINTRVELSPYWGWWMDSGGTWHLMDRVTRGGYRVPSPYGLVPGLRGCYDQYFVDEREALADTISDTMQLPERPASGSWTGDTYLTVKPAGYYRWHGWGDKTVFDTPQTCKAVYWTIYARLVVENDALPDDRDDARFVLHTGSDRKDYDGTQLWDMGISRFKRVTNDWQPFNFLTGIASFAELEANPPPIDSVPSPSYD